VQSVLGGVGGSVVVVELVVVVVATTVVVVVVAAAQRAVEAARMATTTIRLMTAKGALATAVPTDLNNRRGVTAPFLSQRCQVAWLCMVPPPRSTSRRSGWGNIPRVAPPSVG
jgi:hypothetical protein